MFKTLNLKKLILSFLIPFGVAFLSEILTKNAMEEYANLASPPLSPPGVVFPIVWAVLYFLMSYHCMELLTQRLRSLRNHYAI